MAQRGTPLPAVLVRTIQRAPLSVRKTARHVGVAKSTVQKYRKKPA